MSEAFQITYKIALEGAQAAQNNLNGVSKAFQQNRATAQEVDLALQRVDAANSKVAASVTRAGNAFNSAHPKIATFERALSRVSSIASVVTQAMTAINLLTLVNQGASTKLAEQLLVEDEARRSLAMAIQIYGEESVKAQLALQALNEAEADVIETIKEDTQVRNQNIATIAATVAQVGAVLALTAIQIAKADAMKVVILKVGSAIAAVGGGAVILGAGLIAGGIAFGTVAIKALELEDALGRGNVTLEDARAIWEGVPGFLREPLAQLTFAFTQLSAALPPINVTAFQNALNATGDFIANTLGNWISQFETWVSNGLGILGQWGADLLTGFGVWLGDSSAALEEWWASTVQGFRVWAFAIGAVIGAGVKNALNFMIDLLNGAIDGINSLIRAFNTILPPGIPKVGTFGTIPRLQQGTESFGGGIALVGEGGPELAVLPRGTEVIPNNRLRGGAPGGGIIVQVFVAGSVTTREDLVRAISESLSDEASSVF